jgi:hypothetical protein
MSVFIAAVVIFVVVYFVIDSVPKLLDTPSCLFQSFVLEFIVSSEIKYPEMVFRC